MFKTEARNGSADDPEGVSTGTDGPLVITVRGNTKRRLAARSVRTGRPAAEIALDLLGLALKGDNKPCLPDQADLAKPFFSYGLFKPGQLGFLRIRDLVTHVRQAELADCRILVRDGLPLLATASGYRVTGMCCWFNAGQETAAYNRIAELEPQNQYVWKPVTIQLGNETAEGTALYGLQPEEGNPEALEPGTEWDGRLDPHFQVVPSLVRDILDGYPEEKAWPVGAVLWLPMAYLLLWSAIERYATLRYHLGESPVAKIKKIEAEPAYARAYHEVVHDQRVVWNAASASRAPCILDPSTHVGSIEFYYQVRSNATHRGKSAYHDHEVLGEALQQLLHIFVTIKDAAFLEATEIG